MEIQDIKAALSIQTVLNHYNLSPDRNHRLNCPWHNDKTPSLQIYPKTNTWTCFSSNCTAGSGDTIEMIQKMEKCTKDRYIQIPSTLIDILTRYYKKVKPVKYLFNGYNKGERYANSSGQWTMRQAKKNAKISKQASVHTLRHAYATHHLESGTDLVYLKLQLGHKHLRTTERYIHLCAQRKTYVNHPIHKIHQNICWINSTHFYKQYAAISSHTSIHATRLAVLFPEVKTSGYSLSCHLQTHQKQVA